MINRIFSSVFIEGSLRALHVAVSQEMFFTSESVTEGILTNFVINL